MSGANNNAGPPRRGPSTPSDLSAADAAAEQRAAADAAA